MKLIWNEMFEKLKDINNLRKVQADMKKQLEQIFVTEQKAGVRVVIRGDKRIERLEVNEEDLKQVKDVINDALKEVDKKVEKQMKGRLQDLGFPGL